MGTKVGKEDKKEGGRNRRCGRKYVEERPVKKSTRDISLSIQEPNAVKIAKEEARKETAKQYLQSEREKYYIQQAETQFGPDSDAPKEKKVFARQLM